MAQSRSRARNSGLQQKSKTLFFILGKYFLKCIYPLNLLKFISAFENSPLNLQAELMQSAPSKGQPVEPAPYPSHNRVNADIGNDPGHPTSYGNHRMTQKELHNHNGYGDTNSKSPAYQSPPLVQEQYQGKVLHISPRGRFTLNLPMLYTTYIPG